jgi:hypothetical protein
MVKGTFAFGKEKMIPGSYVSLRNVKMEEKVLKLPMQIRSLKAHILLRQAKPSLSKI